MDASTHTAGRAGTRSKTDPAGHPATHSLAEEALFEDRSEAGRLLAAAVAHLAPSRPVVLALPRGGVPVAVPVARALHAPLGLVLVHKIGAPGQPELAVAAVAALAESKAGSDLSRGSSRADGDTLDPIAIEVDEAILRAVGASTDHVEQARPTALAELKRRADLYLRGHPQPVLHRRTVILVDDGVATGTTVRAAIKAIRRAGPARLVLAVPVAPREAAQSLRPLVDEWICLRQPALFHAVGAHYGRFNQVDDDEVLSALRLEPTCVERAEADRAVRTVSAALAGLAAEQSRHPLSGADVG